MRDDGSREGVELETRSLLLHDLLHLAVEAEAGVDTGFWGCLARGKTLADMKRDPERVPRPPAMGSARPSRATPTRLNDRSGQSMKEYGDEMAAIEQVVGGLTAAAKGGAAADVLAGVRPWIEATGRTLPPWLDEAFIERAQARLRALLGAWRATPFGQTMTVTWPR